MFSQFCAGVSLLFSLGVALQGRLLPHAFVVKALSWLAVLAAVGMVTAVSTACPAKLVWLLFASWLGMQAGAQATRRAWLRKWRQKTTEMI